MRLTCGLSSEKNAVGFVMELDEDPVEIPGEGLFGGIVPSCIFFDSDRFAVGDDDAGKGKGD